MPLRKYAHTCGRNRTQGPVSRKSRKAIRQTPTRLCCKPGLLMCCKQNKKNKITAKFRAFVLKIQRIMSPEMSRKIEKIAQVILVEGEYSHQSPWTTSYNKSGKFTSLSRLQRLPRAMGNTADIQWRLNVQGRFVSFCDEIHAFYSALLQFSWFFFENAYLCIYYISCF